MLDKICSKIKLKNIIDNDQIKINKLNSQKINYIKNNEFNKAKQISNIINNYKKDKLKIDESTIYEAFNITKKNTFGFCS